MSDIQRYDHCYDANCSYNCACIEDANGNWVEYSDHAAAIAESTADLQARVAELERELADARNELIFEEMCRPIADPPAVSEGMGLTNHDESH